MDHLTILISANYLIQAYVIRLPVNYESNRYHSTLQPL